MANLPVVRAALIRPVRGEGDAVGLEIVPENEGPFVIALSGEGMKGLIEDMQSFLDEHPEIAEQKSRPRQ
jgi:hypothetical protein